MKTLKFIMFLFYRYYSNGGTHRIPYFSTLCAVVFLIYIHLFQLLIVFDKVDLLPMRENDEKIIKYLKFAAFALPIFLVIAFFIREKDLKNAKYDEDKVERGGAFLIVYIVISIIILFVLMFAFA